MIERDYVYLALVMQTAMENLIRAGGETAFIVMKVPYIPIVLVIVGALCFDGRCKLGYLCADVKLS